MMKLHSNGGKACQSPSAARVALGAAAAVRTENSYGVVIPLHTDSYLAGKSAAVSSSYLCIEPMSRMPRTYRAVLPKPVISHSHTLKGLRRHGEDIALRGFS